jgi:hypothetical protein
MTGTSTGTTSGTTSSVQDCTTLPCTPPQVCCPQSNTCTPANPTDCWGPVWVACTRPSECPDGEVCCVGPPPFDGAATGSVCRNACVFAAGTNSDPDQGYACNTADPNGGVSDCPAGLGTWLQCAPIPNTPASLGMCIGE